jgi:hypothetical protein
MGELASTNLETVAFRNLPMKKWDDAHKVSQK